MKNGLGSGRCTLCQKFNIFYGFLCMIDFSILRLLLNGSIAQDNSYPFCYNAPECLNHLFRECQVAMDIWTAIFSYNFFMAQHNLDFKDWLQANCNKNNDSVGNIQNSSMFFSFTIWTIWFARNQIVHSNDCCTIKSAILNKTQEFLRANPPNFKLKNRTGAHVGWIPL